MAHKGRTKPASEPTRAREGTPTSQLALYMVYNLLRLIVVCGAVVWCVYLAIPLPLSLTAGKQTFVSFVYRAILDFKLHVVLPYAAAATFFGLWQRERHVRKLAVRREHVRVEQLEEQIDPKRDSSGLEE